MADNRFFEVKGPFTLEELAQAAGASLYDDSTAAMSIKDVAPLDTAGQGTISFLDNVKYKDQLSSTKASAVILSQDNADKAPEGAAVLISDNVYKSYALIAQRFYPLESGDQSISEDAIISDGATIGTNCTIEPGAVIMDGAVIGEGSFIEACAVIGRNVELGSHCRVGANATVSHSIIGDHVRIYPGCCIGQDGFGFAIDPAGFVKVPQLGRVVIGNGVEIGANTTIDRGAGPDTVIGDGCWIDNLVQIAHNVKIGRGCIIVSQCGISGSTVLEDFVVMAGQSGAAGHLRIGSGAKIGAQSGVMRDIPAGESYLGAPAMPIKQFMKQTALLKRMLKKDK